MAEQKINFDYYHTTEEIFHELDNIKQHCSQEMEIEQLHSSPDLRVVYMNKQKSKKYQGFLLFGEHPRELITSETGLNFVKQLCKNESELAQKVNNNFSLQILVNANPISRTKVEQGQYCLRENEDGVDINRNYDAHWEYNVDDIQQISSGSEPFSEIQTQTVKKLLEAQQPDYFITVHSGTLGLFIPYAYNEEIAEKNGKEMYEIMSKVNDDYCQECSVGSAGKQVGYICPGTSLDYAYENLGTPFSYAMEIYEKGIDVQQLLQQRKTKQTQSSYLDLQNQSKKESREEWRRSLYTNSFLQTDNIFGNEYEKCFKYFNPEGKEEYNFVVDNWTNALFSSIDLTFNKLEQ